METLMLMFINESKLLIINNVLYQSRNYDMFYQQE